MKKSKSIFYSFINLIRKKASDDLKYIPYQHTTEYMQYFSDAVSAEKKLLIRRGLDSFNVGCSPRSFEIARLIDSELRDADRQLSEHHAEYKSLFDNQLSKASEKRSEFEQLRQDLAALDRHIVNLESLLSEDESYE